MAAEIKKQYNVEARLAADNPGGFDVIVDGKTVFTMSKAQRFPRPGEVAEAIRKLE